MNSKAKHRDQSFNLNGLRSVLFTTAKWRWGTGVIIGYLAILIMPFVIYFDFQDKWLGAVVAAVLSIIGKLLRWRSDLIRGDADRLHRANELCTGIGHPADRTMIADIRSRYPRFIEVSQKKEKDQNEYYEEGGTPSPNLLVAQLRESAWWTGRLAATAKQIICTLAFVALAISLSVIFADSISARVYGLAICIIILTDMFYLGFRYKQLEKDCTDAFRDLDHLKNRCDLTIQQAAISAANYQIVRGTGPLIPDWLWRCRQSKLQAAWEPLSMVQSE